MSTTPIGAGPAPAPGPTAAAKAPWRFAAERRLGRVARQLVGVAEAELPWALDRLGLDAVMAATREPRWALACLSRAADTDDGSELQGAWVLLAASRPTVVRRAILGEPRRPSGRRRHRSDRHVG
jgi:hypothetical protein